ncbi:MAG: hypothetical protein IPK98_09690 [Chloracidobacterium sp.]|nr:hypothetical protein [Chloracidobacterium sp.]
MKRYLPIAFLLILSAAVYGQNIRVTILHVNDVYQFAPVDWGIAAALFGFLTLKNATLAQKSEYDLTLGGDTISPSVETRTYKVR